ncbi:MAG: rRNA synthase [Acidobacteriota bacterium]|jgi:23S rRNA pseudouridine1911/1915/1917 synthase|nr:rRNA synthase [Acidobacteriota bacterium]
MHEETADPEASILTFRPALEDVGSRLDTYLADRIADWSRSRIQRLIEDGDVLVGGRATKPSHKLRHDDEVEVELTPAKPAEFTPEDIPLDVIYEDEHLIVINKSAGLIVHPAAGISSGTLVNGLAYRFSQLRISDCGFGNEEPKNALTSETSKGSTTPDDRSLSNPQSAIRNPQSKDFPRPGIVHRLDKNTSGLIVVAKTERSHEHLADQFRDRKVFKSYVALVHGRVKDDEGRIDQPIARDRLNRTRMAVVRGGRPSLSIYKARRRYDRFTLLDVEIKTGRTHQIRVHLQWLKHPVVGDAVYGDGRDKTVADPRVRARITEIGRQFLHAEKLGFRHPETGERLNFSAPLPVELSNLLDELNNQS